MRKIGLDLGTGKCCVAIAHNGKVTVLQDARGDKTTPSFVAFNEYRTLAGSDARDQANINATNTVYGIKTILGRTLEDPVVIRKLKKSESNVALPFPSYEAGQDGVPEFQFEYKKDKLAIRPEQITALLIGKMKSVAENNLGLDVNGAVISVPVSFNTAQRQATLDAARIAGLKNSTLVNCTTAAAVAYWDHTLRKNDCIAVVDIGAGSVNFAIVSIKSGNIKVEEAYGDCEVGGSDIDLCMMSALVQKFCEEKHVEFQRSTKALMRLRRATESLKHTLSLLPIGRIQEDAFSVEEYTSMTFTREEMVESCKEVLNMVRAGLSRLKSSEFWDKVRCAVVVGGSTRIPAVQRMISSELNKPVDQSLNKDEAIACGAALLGSASNSAPEVVDVLGRRIWCESKTEDFVVFDVVTVFPDETALERPLPCDMEVWENLTPLEGGIQDKFKLCSLPAHNKNKPEDEGGLIFSVNENGIFRADRISEGKSKDIALKIPCLNDDTLSGCVETHNRFLRESKELEESEDAMNDLEYFCSEQRQIVEEELDGNQELTQFLDSVLKWLEDTPDATKKECDLKRREIENKISVLKPHAMLEANAKPEDDLNTPMTDEQVPLKPGGDRTERFVQYPSCETKTIETISCQTGGVGKQGDSRYAEYYVDNGLNSKDTTSSKDSKDRFPYSNDHIKKLVPTSGSQSKPSDEVSSRGDNSYINSYTQGSQNYSAYKPLIGNNCYLWSRDTREQLTDGHQPVSPNKPGLGKGSSFGNDTQFPSEINSSRSEPPDYLTVDMTYLSPEMNRPRSNPNPPEKMTGDLGSSSKNVCMESDYKSSHNFSQQNYQRKGYCTGRPNEHTARNGMHRTIPGVHYSSHAENQNRGKTSAGSRSRASRDVYFQTNQIHGNTHQASRTPGVPNLANDVRSPKVNYRSPCQSTVRTVSGSVVRQQWQDRSRQSHSSPAGKHGSGGHAHQYDNDGEPGTRKRKTDTNIPMRGREVGEKVSEKSEKTSIPWYKKPVVKLIKSWNYLFGEYTEPQSSDEAHTYV